MSDATDISNVTANDAAHDEQVFEVLPSRKPHGRCASAEASRTRWRASGVPTGGRSGLPVIELGRSPRVPRAALRQLIDPTSATEAA